MGRRGSGAFAGRISAVAAQYLLFITLARTHGAGGMGIFSLTLSLWLVTGVVARLGLDFGSLQAVAAARARGAEREATGVASAVIGAALLLGVLAGLAFLFAAPPLARLFEKPDLLREIRVAGLGVPFLTVMWVASGLIQGAHRVALAIWLRDVVPPVLMIVGIVLLTLVPALRAVPLASAMSGSALLASVILVRVAAREFSIEWRSAVRFVNPHFMRVLSYSLPLTLVTVVNAGTQWMDRFFVGFYLPADQLGVYDGAARLARMVTISLLAAGSVFAPIAAQLSTSEPGPERRLALRTAYRFAGRWGLLISLPLAVLLVVRPTLLLSLFGAEFGSAAEVLRILAIGQLLNVSAGPAGSLLIMSGHQRTEAANTLLTVAIGSGLYIVLVPRMGLTGAAVATASSIGAINFLRVLQGFRLEGVLPFSVGMIRALAAALGAGVVLALLPLPHQFALIPLVLEQALVAGFVYVALLLLFGLDPDDRAFLSSRGRAAVAEPGEHEGARA